MSQKRSKGPRRDAVADTRRVERMDRKPREYRTACTRLPKSLQARDKR